MVEEEVRSKAILDRIPAGRWGLPADVQGATIFLASTASDYVNGHVLVVDGGWWAREGLLKGKQDYGRAMFDRPAGISKNDNR